MRIQGSGSNPCYISISMCREKPVNETSGNLANEVGGMNVSTSTHLAFHATTPSLHVPAASPVNLRFFNTATVEPLKNCNRNSGRGVTTGSYPPSFGQEVLNTNIQFNSIQFKSANS